MTDGRWLPPECASTPENNISKGDEKMSAVGTWNVFFDWGCNGSPGQFTITFNSDGSTSTGGSWAEVAGMLMFNWTSGPAVYSANVAGGSMTGMMTTFTGTNGCWWALSQTTSAALASEETEYAPDGSKR